MRKMSGKIKLGRYFEGRNEFYLMHLSYGTWTEEDRRKHWKYAKDHGYIGLDLPEDVPKDWNEMSHLEKQALRSRRPNWFRHFEMFCNEMKVNDLVVVANGWDSLLGVGKVDRPKYEYRKELTGVFFDHVRSIEWEKAQDYDSRVELDVMLKGFNRALIKVKANTRFWEILTNADL